MAAGATVAASVAGVSVSTRANSSRALHRKALHCEMDDREMVAAAEVFTAPAGCCIGRSDAWFCTVGSAKEATPTCMPEKQAIVAEPPGGNAPGWHMKRSRSRRSAKYTTMRCLMTRAEALSLHDYPCNCKCLVNFRQALAWVRAVMLSHTGHELPQACAQLAVRIMVC